MGHVGTLALIRPVIHLDRHIPAQRSPCEILIYGAHDAYHRLDPIAALGATAEMAAPRRILTQRLARQIPDGIQIIGGSDTTDRKECGSRCRQYNHTIWLHYKTEFRGFTIIHRIASMSTRNRSSCIGRHDIFKYTELFRNRKHCAAHHTFSAYATKKITTCAYIIQKT